MFRKKHSEINIQVQRQAYSPFRAGRYSPLTRTPERTNLSPMKNLSKHQPHSNKTPRKHLTAELYIANKQPFSRDTNFESQLQCLGNTLFSEYESGTRQKQSKRISRAPSMYEGQAFSNISNNQPSDRFMNESKKIFSKALSKMNSQKKRDLPSNKNSVFEDSRGQQSNYAQPQFLPIASFKELKQIRMIESQLPFPPPALEKISSRKASGKDNLSQKSNKQSNGKTSLLNAQLNPVNQFKEQKNRREIIVELINQSFSRNPTEIEQVFQGINIPNDQLQLEKPNQIFESLFVDESIQFEALNALLTKLDEDGKVESGQKAADANFVKVSMQMAKLSLTMDPFI